MTDLLLEAERNQLIHSSIRCTRHLLEKALLAAIEAEKTLDRGESRNLAIGWLIDIERQIEQANALYTTTLCLHRQSS